MIRWRVLVDGVDLACSGLYGSHAWGRDTVDGQPESATCAIAFRDPLADHARAILPLAVLELVAVLDTGAESPRFAGTVVDVEHDHETGETTVRAAGELARLAREYVGDTPWPAESDGDRILRILDLAGVDVSGRGRWVDEPPEHRWVDEPSRSTWRGIRGPDVDAGTVTILPRDVDAQPVTRLLRDTAASARGIITERRDGTLAYLDRHARTRHVDLTLDACELLASSVFVRSTDGLVNRVRVAYGTAVEGSDRPTVLAENTGSVDTFGRFDLAFDSVLADEADADELARDLVNTRHAPAWQADRFDLDSLVCSPAVLAAVMAAEMGDTVHVHGIDPAAPFTERLMVLEGMTERVEPGRWVAELALSDARLSIVGASWVDHGTLDPGRRWVDVPPDVAWYDADRLLPIT